MKPLRLVFFTFLVLNIWAESEKDLSQSEDSSIGGVNNADILGGNIEGGVKENPSQGSKQNTEADRNAAGRGGQKLDLGGNSAQKPGTPNFGQKTNTPNSGQKPGNNPGKTQGPLNSGTKPGTPNTGAKTGNSNSGQKQGPPNFVKNTENVNAGQNQGTPNSGKSPNNENGEKSSINLNSEKKVESQDIEKNSPNTDSENKVENKQEIRDTIDKNENNGSEQVFKVNITEKMEESEIKSQEDGKDAVDEFNKVKPTQDIKISEQENESNKKEEDLLENKPGKDFEDTKNCTENILDTKENENTTDVSIEPIEQINDDSNNSEDVKDEKIESIFINEDVKNETENSRDDVVKNSESINEDNLVETILIEIDEKPELNENNLDEVLSELVDEPPVHNEFKPDVILEIHNTLELSEKIDEQVPISDSPIEDDLLIIEIPQTEENLLSSEVNLSSVDQSSLVLDQEIEDDLKILSLQTEDFNQTEAGCHLHEHNTDYDHPDEDHQNTIDSQFNIDTSSEEEKIPSKYEQDLNEEINVGNNKNPMQNTSEEIPKSFNQNIVYIKYIQLHDNTKILIFSFFSKYLANQDLRALFYIFLVLFVAYLLYHSGGGVEYKISQVNDNNCLPGLLRIIDAETEKTKKVLEEKLKKDPTSTDESKIIEDIFESLQRIQDIEADFKAQVLESNIGIQEIILARNTPTSPPRRISIPIPLE